MEEEEHRFDTQSEIRRKSVRVVPSLVPTYVQYFGYTQRETPPLPTVRTVNHVTEDKTVLSKKKIYRPNCRMKKWRSQKSNREREAQRQRERRRKERDSKRPESSKTKCALGRISRFQQRVPVNEETGENPVLRFPESPLTCSISATEISDQSQIRWHYQVERTVQQFEHITYVHRFVPSRESRATMESVLKLSSVNRDANRRLLYVRPCQSESE